MIRDIQYYWYTIEISQAMEALNGSLIFKSLDFNSSLDAKSIAHMVKFSNGSKCFLSTKKVIKKKFINSIEEDKE
jgi:hypothetical protein